MCPSFKSELILVSFSLVIAGTIAVAAFFAVLAFASVIFKQYLLTVTVFNFDPSNVWKSLGWYGDNAQLLNGEWQNQDLSAFVSQGKHFMSSFSTWNLLL